MTSDYGLLHTQAINKQHSF